ncbi:hypothetical protein [Massilia sp. MS-15]|uniref:hypothetical protein n=1 Tax=Massilia sp. MS-15 TaxID=2878200 RepID=UPI001CD773B7|nr:hypothetical protein [Massilia sp. MS-15]MCA1246118.1 hypothetical protein [Massilia sp. MS-15]
MKPLRVLLLACLAVALHGCESMPLDGLLGPPIAARPVAGPAPACNPAALGMSAAALCGATAPGGRRGRDSAACAAAVASACQLANSYQSQQLRSARQTEAEYRSRNRELPARATVLSYRSSLSPSGTLRRGQAVTVTSTILAIPGRYDRGILIEEEVGLVDARGERWGTPVKKVANTEGQAGEFRTVFTIPILEGFARGTYYVRRTLYVNGAAVKSDTSGTRFEVAWQLAVPQVWHTA